MNFKLLLRENATKQAVACSHGTLAHDPTISFGRNRSLFTIFQPGGGGLRQLQLGALLSQNTQHFPCSPKGYKPKANPIVSYILILSQLHKRFCSSLGSHYPHAAALSFRIWGVLLSACVIVQESLCHGTLDHGAVQERHKSQESR